MLPEQSFASMAIFPNAPVKFNKEGMSLAASKIRTCSAKAMLKGALPSAMAAAIFSLLLGSTRATAYRGSLHQSGFYTHDHIRCQRCIYRLLPCKKTHCHHLCSLLLCSLQGLRHSATICAL